jgi:hypothetical protein
MQEFFTSGRLNIDKLEALYDATDRYETHPFLRAIQKAPMAEVPAYNDARIEAERLARMLLLDAFGEQPPRE